MSKFIKANGGFLKAKNLNQAKPPFAYNPGYDYVFDPDTEAEIERTFRSFNDQLFVQAPTIIIVNDGPSITANQGLAYTAGSRTMKTFIDPFLKKNEFLVLNDIQQNTLDSPKNTLFYKTIELDKTILSSESFADNIEAIGEFPYSLEIPPTPLNATPTNAEIFRRHLMPAIPNVNFLGGRVLLITLLDGYVPLTGLDIPPPKEIDEATLAQVSSILAQQAVDFLSVVHQFYYFKHVLCLQTVNLPPWDSAINDGSPNCIGTGFPFLPQYSQEYLAQFQLMANTIGDGPNHKTRTKTLESSFFYNLAPPNYTTNQSLANDTFNQFVLDEIREFNSDEDTF